MTNEEIDAMEAGREMDALIAERVMGWTRAPSEDDPAGWCWVTEHSRTRGSATTMMPPFSADIAAAWTVVEKVEALRSRTQTAHPLHLQRCSSLRRWECWIGHCRAFADTAPLAICRAALKAIVAAKAWEKAK